MYIRRHMQKPARTVGPEDNIAAARRLMEEGHFRHLPVVDNKGLLLGMLSDRDLRSASPSSLLAGKDRESALEKLSSTPVAAVMSTRLSTLSPDATLDDALLLLDREKVGSLPVVDGDGRVVGIFSVRDLMRAYRQLFGLGERGSALVTVLDDGRPKPFTRIVQALEERDIPFTRLVHTAADEEGLGRIFVRVHTLNLRAVNKALADAGFSLERPASGA